MSDSVGGIMNTPKPRTRRRIRILAPLFLAAVIALVIATAAIVSASFSPTASSELSSTDSSEPVDITTNFEVPAGDVNYDATADFTPMECDDGVPGFFVAADADVPDGTKVAELSSNATLGLTITPCNINLGVDFDLVDATTDTSNSFVDAGVPDVGPGMPGAWNGYDMMPSGNMRAVDQYPGFLLDLYPGVEPRARYFGWTEVPPPFPPGLFVILQFLVFEPGQCPAGYSCPIDWGYPSISVLNIPNAPASASSPLGDFCSSLTTETIVFGEADSYPVRTNPAYEATCTFHNWSRGLPDADGDGYENGIDTCPFNVNIDTNPRANLGPDTDAIDGSCDPQPAVNNTDYDLDNFANNADNCPLVANEDQLDTDGDGIGDVCDTAGNGPDVIDGARPTVESEDTVSISGPPFGVETATPTPTPTATATATATATGTVTGTETPVVTATPTTVVGEGCAPVIPGTYNGLVRLNGVPAPAGYEVTATIDGTEWGSTIVSGGRYALDVPQKLPAAEPCFSGGTITFMIDGGVCEPTVDWASGLHDVDLSCAPAATATVVPPATPPPATPSATPVVTPAKPPVTGSGGLGGEQGLPLWAMILLGWGSLTALAGFGTLATRIAKR
jgi:hypothetical protein